MGQHEKLIAKARRNPNGISMSEFETLMSQCGWVKDRQRGSHQIWYSLRGERLSVQTRKGMAKGYQVKQFLSFMEEKTDE